jgi:hypothetical protein
MSTPAAAADSFPAAEEFFPLTLPGINVKTERLAEDRQSRILSLHRQGLDRLNIAKGLAVTVSEVDLVLGLAAHR